MIRKLFEIPAEPERRAHAEPACKGAAVFWRWLKKAKSSNKIATQNFYLANDVLLRRWFRVRVTVDPSLR